MTIVCKPQMASHIGYGASMRRVHEQKAAEVLAESVRRLIDHVGSQTGLEKKTKVPQKTISRALHVENVTIGTVEDLALGCGFRPWQVLVPDFDPQRPPILSDKRRTDRIQRLADLLERVPEEKLHIIEDMAEALAAKSGAPFLGPTDARDAASAG